jgi:hypothetical protein
VNGSQLRPPCVVVVIIIVVIVVVVVFVNGLNQYVGFNLVLISIVN